MSQLMQSYHDPELDFWKPGIGFEAVIAGTTKTRELNKSNTQDMKSILEELGIPTL